MGKRQKTCIQCGAELPKNKTKYCSIRCGKINRGEIFDHGELTKICPICGREFKTFKSRKITCSEECSKKWHNVNNKQDKEYYREKYKKKHPEALTKEERFRVRAEQKKEKEQQKATAREKREKKLARKKAKKQKNKDFWLNYNRFHICENCGEVYQAISPLSKYCSKKCMKKALKQRHKDPDADKSLTLKRLSIRDNNICRICGEPVDWNDYKVVDGITICGDRYPSKDHIYPKSKGGPTKWNNMQLAHRICNSRKRDLIDKG